LADLILQAGYPIQVVGKTEEAPLGSYLAEAGPGVSDLMGRTNLRQLGALVTASALVIGNDSGVIHLSSALGTRVLTIFGPTSPRATYPTGADACVLWNQVACAPCFKRVCPIDHPCMRDLQAGEVWATAQALLNGQVPTSPHIVPRPDLRGIALA
jgi:heptosyltransferase-2